MNPPLTIPQITMLTSHLVGPCSAVLSGSGRGVVRTVLRRQKFIKPSDARAPQTLITFNGRCAAGHALLDLGLRAAFEASQRINSPSTQPAVTASPPRSQRHGCSAPLPIREYPARDGERV